MSNPTGSSGNNHSNCGCCAGGTHKVDRPKNRAGLSELSYRVGTYGSFFEAMRTRLSSQDYPALAGLNTRAPDDPSIALLDAWATVADVLSFYSERQVNEGYLRTAGLQRSVTELARLVGYQPRPGVASSVFLAYTLDDNAKQDTVIPKGTRSQSIPGPGELPQSFETSDPLQARPGWNQLQPRMQRPYHITGDQALTIKSLHLEGTALNLKPGDHLLLVFGKDGSNRYIRKVQTAEPLLLEGKTRVLLQPVLSDFDASILWKELNRIAQSGGDAETTAFFSSLGTNLALGSWQNLNEAREGSLAFISGKEDPLEPKVHEFFEQFKSNTDEATPTRSTSIGDLTGSLLQPGRLQPRNALRQIRDVKEAFKTDADAAPQLLVKFAPRLGEHFYPALASANLNLAQPELQAIYVLRLTAPLFGYNAPARTGLVPNNEKESGLDVTANDGAGPVRFISATLDKDWKLHNEAPNVLSLDNQYDNLLPDGYVLVQQPIESSLATRRQLLKLVNVIHQPRSDYSLSGKTTRLLLDANWREADANDPQNAKATPPSKDTSSVQIQTPLHRLDWLRPTLVRTQSELLQLAQEPIDDDIGLPQRKPADTEAVYQAKVRDSKTIDLDQLHSGLQAGRWLIVSGERADIDATAGVIQSELAMLANVTQTFNDKLPGDKTLSRITLETPLAYRYKRATVKIYGNVVKATHGETRSETLGSGNASLSLQAFTLKQPPLTYVSSTTPEGAASTLEVYVNDLRWHETDSLAGQSPYARLFVTKTDDEAKTTVIFGNGKEGARLPSGQENIKARYRNGIGKAGNVGGGQISLLVARPLGVKAVINPLPATGGSDRETRDQARANAPLALKALDRLVSVKDYEDFARLFAGIGKASAQELTDGQRRLVHVTIAGADDIPIDETSDLFQNLRQALLDAGDPNQPIQLAIRELVFVVISANIRLLPDYLWEPVVTSVRAALLDTFSFTRRQLGQPIYLSEVISCIQAVRGVDYVDVDYLRSVPEKENGVWNSDSPRPLVSLDTITRLLTDDPDTDSSWQSTNQTKNHEDDDPRAYIPVNLAHKDGKGIRPAQLAFLNPEVPATLILNPIN